jgi:hypothetical protein
VVAQVWAGTRPAPTDSNNILVRPKTCPVYQFEDGRLPEANFLPFWYLYFNNNKLMEVKVKNFTC